MADSSLLSDRAALDAWTIDAGLAGMPVPELFDGFCGRLTSAGVALARGYLSFATLHPLVWATGYLWQDGRGIEPIELPYGFERMPAWTESPFRHMLATHGRRLHRRLTGAQAQLDFPVLREFRDAGLTEWLALLYPFGWQVEHSEIDELGVILSWATDRAAGWTAQEIEAIEALSRSLAIAVKAGISHRITRDLLGTYLGRDAAERVIFGQVRRGSVERRSAIILDADLRGFTDFSESVPPEEVARRLDAAFDGMGAPIKEGGGEILKFLGDGLLAIFLPDWRRDVASVAEAALDAALGILARMEALNAGERDAGNPALPVDVALHVGDVTYGNVGTADRLDFTVIGPAVNEVARLEGLCKELACPLLISDAFVRAAPALLPRLRPLGRHRLRGVRAPIEVFTSGET